MFCAMFSFEPSTTNSAVDLLEALSVPQTGLSSSKPATMYVVLAHCVSGLSRESAKTVPSGISALISMPDKIFSKPTFVVA